MTEESTITTLFLDIGGVLLTNGWDHTMRQHACEIFGIDYEEMNERHHLTFDTLEEGKLTLEEYLDRVVFYKKRAFSREKFKDFIFAQSKPHPDMIDLMKELKTQHNLEIIAVSNEGRELTTYRIREFGLRSFIDAFISSCFVHFRKPDKDMYRMALDVSQTPSAEVVYIEDRTMFVEVARSMGMRGIVHKDFASTRDQLAEWGLVVSR